MRRNIFVLLLFSIIVFSLSAANHLSLPLGHRAYNVLESAELRGIIEPISSVKPYPRSIVISNLKKILESNKLKESEIIEIETLLSSLEISYQTPNNFDNILFNGSYSSYWEKYKIGTAFGISLDFIETFSLTQKGHFDSRNGGRAYLKGDITDYFSYYMDIGIRGDRLDTRLFLPNDFTIPSEGKYDSIVDSIAASQFYYGIDYHPEMALQFMDGNLQFRWGAIQRDWGVGINNIMLSGSARSFEGIETSLKLAPWFEYQFITGSLGKYWLKYLDQVSFNENYFDEYFYSDGMQDTRYNNNFSAHRVELKLPFNLQASIYESVVYRKRFEIGYLNPFAILMYEQNIAGDFDNVLAGVDLQWRLPGIMRVYGALATTEMYEINPKKFFKEPRNIMAFQAGLDFNLPVANFAKVSFQYTYLGPFFYTHYPIEIYNDKHRDKNNEENKAEEPDEVYEIIYVNKGENLGYPLQPNSDEFLITASMGFRKGWNSEITVKYQRRSGQYGFSLDKYMVYRAAQKGEYDEKDFNNNLFEHRIGLELSVSKTFEKIPMSIRIGYLYNMKIMRNLTPNKYWNFPADSVADPADPVDPSVDYPIQYTVSGPWSSPIHTHAVQIGLFFWH